MNLGYVVVQLVSRGKSLITIFARIRISPRKVNILNMLPQVPSVSPFFATQRTTVLSPTGDFLNVLIEIE